MRDFVPLKGFGAEGTLLRGRDAFFPSPDGRGLKVRDLIQRAFFRARFKIPLLLPTREEFMQRFLLQKQILLRAYNICDDASR